MTKEQKFLLLAVLIVAGVGVTYYVTHNKTEGPTPTTATTPVTTKQAVIKSYQADVPYTIPNGKSETIHVGITLTDGVISDITFSTEAPGNPASKENIDAFTAAFQNGAALKGKKLSEVSVVRVGGASLTSKAFMEAVTKISAQVNG